MGKSSVKTCIEPFRIQVALKNVNEEELCHS
jgi:hypothetical protein